MSPDPDGSDGGGRDGGVLVPVVTRDDGGVLRSALGSAYHPHMDETDARPDVADPGRDETSSGTAALAEDLPTPDGSGLTEDADPASSRRSSRSPLVAVVVALAVLVVAAVVWATVAGERSRAELEDARSSLSAHLAERSRVIDRAEEASARGVEVHAASAGEVLDDSVREDLATALDVLDAAVDAVQEVTTAPTANDLAAVREVVAAVAPAVAATTLAVDEVELSIEAVVDAQAAWALATAREELDPLVEELTTLVGQADETLGRSEDAVLDEGTRAVLSEVLGRAVGRLSTSAPSDEDLVRTVETLRDLLTELATAVAAVDGSSAAWQEEQERLAADHAARAAPPAQPPRSSPVPPRASAPATGSAPAPSGAGSQPAPARPAPAPAPAPAPVVEVPPAPAPVDGGSYWVETETGFGSDLCGDEFGNSWEC